MIESLEELLDLATLEDVQDELELTEKQATTLVKLLDAGETRLQELQERKDEAEFPDSLAIVSEAISNEFEKIQSEIQGLLLPHQIERLSQIALQRKLTKSLRNKGAFGVLAMAKELDLTVDQVSKIKEVVKENEAGFQAEVRQVKSSFVRLRETYRDEMKKELNASQSVKFEKLVGAEFLDPSWVGYWFDLCEADRNFRSRNR
jgi:Spy/CpxP family protein refolding chaperone